MHGLLIDLTGQVFGDLTVIGYHKESHRTGMWICLCTCGGRRDVSSQKLRDGFTTHCGCKHTRNVLAASIPARTVPIYRSWVSMRQRCFNPVNEDFHYYGGRGIKVCDRWANFKNFYEDMSPRPPNTSLDRIDSNGDYTPDNCRWATSVEQNNNSSNCRLITFNGETLTLTGWASRLGICLASLSRRLKTWTLERALTTPRKS